MMRLILLFTFLSTLSVGQTQVDYDLYSQAINSEINYGIKNGVKTTEVVIITRYVPDDNQISAYGSQFLDKEEQLIHMVLRYDTSKIRLFKDSQLRDAIRLLEKEFYETPKLDETKFNLDLTPAMFGITDQKFKGYFRTIFGKRIDKGWKKFYKRYPGSHGVYEFSKIAYRGEYACFYMGRHSNGLSGSGDMIIAKKLKGNWTVINVVNIWMS